MRYNGIRYSCEVMMRMGEASIYSVNPRQGAFELGGRFSILEPTLIGKAIHELAPLSQELHFTGSDRGDKAPGEFEMKLDSRVKEIFGEPKRRTDLHNGALSDWDEPLAWEERPTRRRRTIDPVDTAGATPLMLAAASGYPWFVKRLLKLGADHRRSDNNGRAALHYATESARNECAGALIDAGADVHCVDSIGDTPLHLAAARGHGSTVRLLLESGADPNAADSAFSSTPLHKAVRGDHASLVPILVAAGADVDSRQFSRILPESRWGGEIGSVYFREHNSEAAWTLLERGGSIDPLRIPIGDRHALWPHLTPKELLFDSGSSPGQALCLSKVRLFWVCRTDYKSLQPTLLSWVGRIGL